jgi:hypothetical protein
VDSWLGKFGTRHDDLEAFRRAGWGSIPVFFPPGWQVTRVSSYVRGPFPSKEIRRILDCTREAVDRFGIPNPPKSRSVIGADLQRFGPSCVLLKRVLQGRTESAGIVLAANAGPRVPRPAPSGGVTLKRRCTYRPSVIYLIVNKLLSLSLSPHRKCTTLTATATVAERDSAVAMGAGPRVRGLCRGVSLGKRTWVADACAP